jgi:hypothetical protein
LLDRREAVASLRDDLNVGVPVQNALDALPSCRVIVHDQDADRTNLRHLCRWRLAVQHHSRCRGPGAQVGECGPHGCPMLRVAGNLQFASQAVHPRGHTQQAEAPMLIRRSGLKRKTAPIVFDSEQDGFHLVCQAQDHIARGRMFVDVLERLLGYPKQRRRLIRCQRPFFAMDVELGSEPGPPGETGQFLSQSVP